MTKSQALGRHRATPVHTNPLGSISKAVSSNAGSVGRQAAVIAAASGLVLTLGLPAEAAPAARAADKAPITDVQRASVTTPAAVTVPAAKSKSKGSQIKVSVADISSTSGAAYREAQRQAAAEREAAEQAAAAEREAAQQAAAAEREAAQEAAADRQAAETSQSSSSQGTASASSSSSDSNVTTASAGTVTEKAEPASAPSAGLSGIAATAMQYKGSPYVFGGSSPSGWDCSGFVQYVYGQHGISLPHNTSAIRGSGKFVSTSNPKPGDLVYQNGGSHVGIYIGGGKIIGAQNPSVGTVIRPADSPYGPLMGYYTYVG